MNAQTLINNLRPIFVELAEKITNFSFNKNEEDLYKNLDQICRFFSLFSVLGKREEVRYLLNYDDSSVDDNLVGIQKFFECLNGHFTSTLWQGGELFIKIGTCRDRARTIAEWKEESLSERQIMDLNKTIIGTFDLYKRRFTEEAERIISAA